MSVDSFTTPPPTFNKPGGPNDVNMGMVNYDSARIVIQPNMSQAQAEIAGAVMNHSLGMLIDVKHHSIKQSDDAIPTKKGKSKLKQ